MSKTRNHNADRRDFLLKTTSAVAASSVVAACGGSDAAPAPAPAPAPVLAPAAAAAPASFAYGVASGDPLADRVILWTHAKRASDTSPVALTWQVASESSFATVISSGKVDATEASSFTAKVDATGLTAGATYFYRFRDATGATSTVGTTRTLPANSVAAVKLVVFSCSLYSEGFFNAYAEAAKSDAQYAVHLGDYIYEYGSDAKKYGNTDAVALGRVVSPANDMVSLTDYRTRHALYKSDPNLQAAHAKMPWITVWDDHEFTNDSYVTGAENHSSATQGDWVTRKNTAAKVYHEWMPIRTPDASNLLKIYRRFDFGSLLTLHMIDTRIEGRDRQYNSFGDADGGVARYVAGITPNAGVLPDASRRMMSTTQQAWLTDGMVASAATWQFLGNQTVMARMWLPVSILRAQQGAAQATAIQDYLAAKATPVANRTAVQTALLDKTTNPGLPFNLEGWDGYPANRDSILTNIKSLNKKLVVLSGDSHNGWFTNLTTLAGVKVGVEFAGSSVTSTGFEGVGLGALGPSLDGSVLGAAAVGQGLGLIDDLNYADTSRRGYLAITISAASVKGDYVVVDTVKSKTYKAVVGKTVTVNASGAITYS